MSCGSNLAHHLLYVNKVLREHSHVHSLLTAYGCFQAIAAELSGHVRDQMAYNA